jgi:hypothetical protein
MTWYSVRCVFFHEESHYEERITLWNVDSFDEAIKRAETEAREYAANLGAPYLGLAQAYWLPDEPRDGAEVFSLIRASDLEPAAYLNGFFDTGEELQQEWKDPDARR